VTGVFYLDQVSNRLGDLLQHNMEEMLLYIFKIPEDRLDPLIFGQMVNSVDMDEIINQAKSRKCMSLDNALIFSYIAGKSKVAIAKLTNNKPISTPRPSNYMNDFYDVASSIVSTILTPRPQVPLLSIFE
jgi:hypothetical protein